MNTGKFVGPFLFETILSKKNFELDINQRIRVQFKNGLEINVSLDEFSVVVDREFDGNISKYSNSSDCPVGISVNTEAVDTIQAYGDTLTEQMLDDGRRVYTVRRFWEIRIEGYTELAYEISLTSFGLGLFDLTINLYKCGGWRISGEKSGGLFILTLEQG